MVCFHGRLRPCRPATTAPTPHASRKSCFWPSFWAKVASAWGLGRPEDHHPARIGLGLAALHGGRPRPARPVEERAKTRCRVVHSHGLKLLGVGLCATGNGTCSGPGQETNNIYTKFWVKNKKSKSTVNIVCFKTLLPCFWHSIIIVEPNLLRCWLFFGFDGSWCHTFLFLKKYVLAQQNILHT